MAKIKNIATQIRGVSYHPEDLHDTLDENSVILLRANNIKDGKLILDDAVYVSKSKVAKQQYLQTGDILICASSGSKELVGKAAFVDSVKNPMTFGAFCKVVRPQPEYSEFLGHYFNSPVYRRKISALSAGANINNIKNEHIDNLDIQLVDEKERREIITILNKLNMLISLRKQQLSKLDELVKARFMEMFGDPVSNSKDLPIQKMNNVAPICQYDGSFEERVWLLNLDMVESQTGRIINYNIVGKDAIGGSVCTFDENNILYSKLRPYLNKVVIPNGKGYATSELVPLRPDNKIINRIYLAYLLRSNEFVEMIKEKVAGAKMPRVSMSDFREFNVPVPPLELQNQFASFVQEIDKSRLLSNHSLSLIKSIIF